MARDKRKTWEPDGVVLGSPVSYAISPRAPVNRFHMTAVATALVLALAMGLPSAGAAMGSSSVGAATATAMAGADATVSQQFGGAHSPWSDDQIISVSSVKSYGGSTDTLIRFDLSAIPRDAIITGAKLSFFRTGNGTDGDKNTGASVEVTQVSPTSRRAGWREGAVTWSSAPPRGKPLFRLSFPPWSLGRLVTFTEPALTRWVQDAVREPRLAEAGWRLWCSGSNNGVMLASHRYPYLFWQPHLVISYKTPNDRAAAAVTDQPSANALQLADFKIYKSGSPTLSELDGRLGIQADGGDSVELLLPHALTGDFELLCHFDARFLKYWTFQHMNEAGIFLRPAPLSSRPMAERPVAAFTHPSWSGDNLYQEACRVGPGHDADAATATQRQWPVYEFYYRIRRSGDRITIAYSKTGYQWANLCSATEPAGYRDVYPGFYVYCPKGSRAVWITLNALIVIPGDTPGEG